MDKLKRKKIELSKKKDEKIHIHVEKRTTKELKKKQNKTQHNNVLCHKLKKELHMLHLWCDFLEMNKIAFDWCLKS